MLDRILLDIDGVLADFVGGALRLFHRLDALEAWPPGEWEVARVIGVADEDFWATVDHGGEDFWARLEPTPWAAGFVELCEGVCPGRVSLLSSPSRDPYSAAGKIQWIRSHFPQFEQRYIFAPAEKELLAAPGRLLIDDNDGNCERFAAAGGDAIVFPQPWNRIGAVPDPVGYVADLLAGAG